MSTAAEQDLLSVMNERHAVRYYDPNEKISREQVSKLIQAAVTAPSSWNLQHWKFLVFDTPEAKQKLFPIANNQQQVLDSSAVIAVLGDLQANKNAERVYGDAPTDIKNTLVGQIEQAYATKPHVPRDEAIRNASLAAMQLMLAAKAMGYDSCPMGGFQADRLMQEFHIPDRYIPVLLISVGTGTKPAHHTERFPVEELIIWNQFS